MFAEPMTVAQRTQQLQLLHDAPENELFFCCRGVFSTKYLEKHFRFADGFPTAEEIQPLYEAAKTRWEDNLRGLRKQKEAFTRTHFIEPLLADLGWHFIPEAELPKGPTRKRPDYCLFTAAEAQQHAAAQSQAVDVFAFAVTVLEAKQWNHPLDRVSKTDTPGWFPSEQIQDYLRHAKDRSGAPLFDWAILTSGKQWRLYCEQAPDDAYFELTLAEGETFCSLNVFRLFVALFRPAAFALTNGRCQLDDFREESLTRQAELELSLRRRIFDVLEDLASGFRDYKPNGVTEADYPVLYEISLVLLYRLLFVLYAESRGLLPVRPHGCGANKVYREKYSVARLVNELRDKSKFTDDAFTDLYEQLLRLFHLINGENEEQNRKTGVPRYNGGLFDHRQYPRLEQWRVGDHTLANVLRQLMFSQPPARAGSRQQQIFTEDAIDYASLEVRQLGDIYEGLLGAHLEENPQTPRLELRNEKGQNHRHGIYYTPDWIVTYLVRETLQPLLDAVEATPDVQRALKAKSGEKRRDNSFALAALKLNLVDPAMGSGHFLVRATEWLARKIVEHATTQRMTEQIVPTGPGRRTREQIVQADKVPVPPGFSQEEAEIAYWRRRVVEACIYGVDLNPLAVELAKLSLWLTCIAADEPLNFLDHHLRDGNSLLFARPDELSHSPLATAQQQQEPPVFPKDDLLKALAAVIEQNVGIEQTASTEMELVKQKEKRWKEVRAKLEPFLDTARLWLAAYDGVPVDELSYRLLVRQAIIPADLNNKEKAEAKKLRESFADVLAAKRAALLPFHWELEFSDVFFQPDGTPRPEAERGFDAVLGNPPYISTHTSSAEKWRVALEKRAGFLEDLYVHFTDLGFQLLRPGGGFGFIVSDTFFTLESKRRMRELLQSHTLTHLGQCDPFEATVDAAIFVARKLVVPPSGGQTQATSEGGDSGNAVPAKAGTTSDLLFLQARPRKTPGGKATEPERFLTTLPSRGKLTFAAATELSGGLDEVAHGAHGLADAIRFHRVPSALYRTAHKLAFFEPRPGTLRLFERFNEPVKKLVEEWWERIETSEKFAANRSEVLTCATALKPGEVTLVGLVAEGGQGLATANNARFLGYLEGTPQAGDILARREQWTQRWLADPQVRPVFLDLLEKNGGEPARPTKNSAAWEACVEPLRERFSAAQLDFRKTDLYRVVPKALVADETDFQFAFQQREAALLTRWRTDKVLAEFWTSSLGDGESRRRARKLQKAPHLSDADFCLLCREMQRWLVEENAARKKQKLPPTPREALGLRPGEDYAEPAGAPRIAVIYHGLVGRGQFVPFRKGDPEGNRWLEQEPLFIHWTAANVEFLFGHSGKKAPQMPVVRNPNFFFLPGVSWTRGANHVPIKAKLLEPAVLDVNAMKLSPLPRTGLSSDFLLAVFNSDVFSFFLKKFIAHTWMAQISDVRMMPLVLPTKAQAARLEELAKLALTAKHLEFAGQAPAHELVAAVRQLSDELEARAPAYLRPPAQRKLLATASDCLEVIELAVNWEAEKLYGVEGQGPFDEF